MNKVPSSLIRAGHPNYESARTLALRLYDACGGEPVFVQEIPGLIRRAIDDVVETPRTARLAVDELDEIERAYLNTRAEILFRDFADVARGPLDIASRSAQVHFSFSLDACWTLPAHAANCVCILLGADEERARCFVGLIRTRPEHLDTAGVADGCSQLTTNGLEHTYWLLRDHPYPPNFWLALDANQVRFINQSRCSPSERLRRLFSTVLRKPISRKTVSDVARQLDPMKRLRKNGGARDALLRDGIALLSGRRHGEVIAKLGLLSCRPDEFISLRIESEIERKILTDTGYFG